MTIPMRAAAATALGLWMMLTGCSGSRGSDVTSSKSLQFETSDGAKLSAAFYPAAAENAPALVLIHEAGGNHGRWETFTRYAQRAGYGCLALDLRGHGQSTGQGGTPRSYRTFRDADWTSAVADVAAAVDAALAQTGGKVVALVGEGMGASLAFLEAAEDPRVRAVVALSPGLDLKGVALEPLIPRLHTLPILLLVGDSDRYAADSAEAMRRLSDGHIELHAYAGSAHGVDLFAAAPHALGQAVLWLDQMVRGSKPGTAPTQTTDSESL